MALLSPGLLRSLTERRHLAETGAREGERNGGRERRKAASPQRLQLEGYSPEEAHRAVGGWHKPTPCSRAGAKGAEGGRLGGGVAAVSSVKLGAAEEGWLS